MTILILNVDRDNDFGRKAGVKSPIIGFKDNLDAANRLGQTDPEDSDLNAIFLAIATYNTLKKEEQDVEIATICGDISVGIKSDQILVDQLETVIKKTNSTNVILISDGAEDEYILPIVQSRLKLNSVKRVSIKQSKELEDAYYRFVKLLDDDKVKKQFVLPLALIFIVWAIFALMGMAASGFGATLFTLGVYLLIRVFNWERHIALFIQEFKSGMLTGRLSFYTTTIALIILVISFLYAYDLAKPDFNSELLWAIPILSFLRHVTWGIVAAGLITAFGRVTDIYVREKKIKWSYWIIPFSLLSFGFTTSAVVESLYNSLYSDFALDPFFTPHFVGYLFIGIVIAFMGVVTHHYIKETYLTEKQEMEIDKETARFAEET